MRKGAPKVFLSFHLERLSHSNRLCGLLLPGTCLHQRLPTHFLGDMPSVAFPGAAQPRKQCGGSGWAPKQQAQRVCLRPCGRQRRRKAQEARVQLQRQLYLSMRKTANYTEAQGSGKEEDGAPSANFVVAAQSRASGRWLVPACSRQCNKAGNHQVQRGHIHSASKKARCQDGLPRQSTKKTSPKAAAAAAAAFAAACRICGRQIAMP